MHERYAHRDRVRLEPAPQGLGTRLAEAMCQLSAFLGDEKTAHHERLFGQDLHLNIKGKDGGVDITVSWKPGPGDTPPPE